MTNKPLNQSNKDNQYVYAIMAKNKGFSTYFNNQLEITHKGINYVFMFQPQQRLGSHFINKAHGVNFKKLGRFS